MSSGPAGLLAHARVLVVGAGGLGCPAAVALARAGVGALTLVDPDTVDPSNLHRQLLHRQERIGHLKVESARDTLKAAFPSTEIAALPLRVDEATGPALFAAHDAVVDGTDGIATKLLLSDLARLTGTPLVHGGVLRLSGMAWLIRPRGPCLRCLFPLPPQEDAVPTCAQAGVLGSVAGVVGALQARLVVQALEQARAQGGWEALGPAESIHHFDAARLAFRRSRLEVDPDCPQCLLARERVAGQERRVERRCGP